MQHLNNITGTYDRPIEPRTGPICASVGRKPAAVYGKYGNATGG